MDEAEFWELIEKAKQASEGDLDRETDFLINALESLGVEEVIVFDQIHMQLMNKAYVAELWDAADLILCGCTDDGFADFRGWLIGQGRAVYLDALDNPDNLANVVSNRFDLQNPTTLFAAQEAYRRLTGEEIMPLSNFVQPELRGTASVDEATLRAKFPLLSNRFSNCLK